jgi:hypothetical protein
VQVFSAPNAAKRHCLLRLDFAPAQQIYHAAMTDPHKAAELDLDQIWSPVDNLLAAHRDWLPAWARIG